MAKRRCNGCKEYFDKNDLELIGVSSFCSRDCFYKKENSLTKARSDSFKSSTGSKSDTDFSPEVKQHVLERDRYRCGLCGRKGGNLAIHHIHYRTEKHEVGLEFLTSALNAITLCNTPCHLNIVHGDKKKWKPILLDLVQRRESGEVVGDLRRFIDDKV